MLRDFCLPKALTPVPAASLPAQLNEYQVSWLPPGAGVGAAWQALPTLPEISLATSFQLIVDGSNHLVVFLNGAFSFPSVQGAHCYAPNRDTGAVRRLSPLCGAWETIGAPSLHCASEYSDTLSGAIDPDSGAMYMMFNRDEDITSLANTVGVWSLPTPPAPAPCSPPPGPPTCRLRLNILSTPESSPVSR